MIPLSIRVELWINRHLVDGVEQWWDDIEAALPEENAEITYPLLSSVDPYSDLAVEGIFLEDLADEARRLSEHASKTASVFLQRLVGLCIAGAQTPDAELRFLGD